MEKEDNWARYFKSIESICPWSLSAYRQNRLKFIQGYRPILELRQYEAIIYLEDEFTPRQLEAIVDQLNEIYAEYEFFWSHPDEGGNSAPEACIIQQNYAKIEQIRQKITQNPQQA